MAEPIVFGQWLKRCRNQHGWTQDELADMVGCATQTIRKIEGGQRRPSFQMAERLAQMLDIDAGIRTEWMQVARDTSEPESVIEANSPLPVSLPSFLSPLIGREREQADILNLLETPQCRLLTLIGPGGCGKTRLAADCARQSRSFSDGAAFVPLAPVATPGALPTALADALGLRFSGTRALEQQLHDFLHSRRLLLVLDNFEHLLDQEGNALAFVERLLVAAPHVTLLVTSRERLPLVSAWAMELEGLPVPTADTPTKPERFPALMMFADHARRVERGFVLNAANLPAVVRICRLVDGMPLGIELATAWLRLLSLDEIAEELLRNMEAPYLSPLIPARHRSLYAVVDHSWQRLSAAERTVLARLSVFHGGFGRESAAAVAGAHLSVLVSLLDKSLVRRTNDGRYSLHEIIRQYAAARLAEHGEQHQAALGSHAAYYARWLASQETTIKSKHQIGTVAAISAEIDNIRAMWHHLLEREDIATLELAAETLHWFFEFSSWFSEGAEFFGRALGIFEHTEERTLAFRQNYGQLLGHYSYLISRLGQLEKASAAAAASCRLLAKTPNTVAYGRSLAYQGMIALQVGDYTLARTALTESLGQVAGDGWSAAFSETWQSVLFHALGDFAESERLFRSGLAYYRATGSPRSQVFCLTYCSPTLVAQGKLYEAQTLLHESLQLASIAEDHYGRVCSFQQLGAVALELNQPQEAAYLLREALELSQKLGNRWDVTRLHNQLGAAHLAAGAHLAACRSFREALALAATSQAHPEAVQALVGLAGALQQQGRTTEAFGLVERALADPACSSETRSVAERQRSHLRAQLSGELTARITSHMVKLPLTAILYELDKPAEQRLCAELSV